MMNSFSVPPCLRGSSFSCGNGPAGTAGLFVQPGGTTGLCHWQADTAGLFWRRCTCGLLLLLVFLPGCTRPHYRRQADREVNCIIDNKTVALGGAPGTFRIDVDPKSRMFDPNSPDCPPMPPDDPISHQLMHCVDCKPGAPCWKHMGKTPYVENPSWLEHLPRDAAGNVVLDLTGAVQVALLESPQYQQQLETLYLSGLDVTFERFRFDSQFFGGSSVFFTSEGPIRAGKAGGSSVFEVNPSRPDNRFRVEKLTATGGEIVVGFANSLMWQFAGPDDYSSSTILDFNLIQPLLRAGGRARVLERLTISERALLSNVRQMEHYQRGFYLNVVTGRDPGQGPNRRGGFFGGSGLEGFSGVGVGGFGRVGGVGFNQQGQVFGFTGGAGAQQAGGYIGLLQTAQVIRNQYSNIAGLGDSLEQLQAAYEAGRIDRFQVDLARQALYNAQSQLLNNENQYADGLDNFKLLHGLPPSLDLKVADPLLDHFNLLDPDLAQLQIRLTDQLTELREGGAGDSPKGVPDEPAAKQDAEREEIRRAFTAADIETFVKRGTEIRRASQTQLAVAQLDLARLKAALPARRAFLERLAGRAETKKANIDPELLSVERLDQRFADTTQEYVTLEQQLAAIWARFDELASAQDTATTNFRNELISVLNRLSGSLLELSLLQARARLDAITFDPVDLNDREAYCIASRYRRDWMNARASVVDAWRLIQFNANFLESDFDLVFSGDLRNASDNPFDLRGSNGRLRAGLQFDPPITRLAERNTYRQSLIEYQQAKRQYYQFRDRVERDLRGSLRQLKLDDLNFELRRAAVHVAITQVDLARLRLSEPARPVQASAPGQPTQPGGQSQFGDTVARDLVNALIDLLNVQNDFLSVWVDHEVQTLNLDFQLGTMELDGRGIRIPHQEPLRTFLTKLPDHAPCEEPDACALPYENEADEGQREPQPTAVDLPPLDVPMLPEPNRHPTGADLLPPPLPPNN
ncbi:MAG: TolC family protein [Pirellulales bacterium]|nr:TolC family protein [Pirellulales bacterium]